MFDAQSNASCHVSPAKLMGQRLRGRLEFLSMNMGGDVCYPLFVVLSRRWSPEFDGIPDTVNSVFGSKRQALVYVTLIFWIGPCVSQLMCGFKH